MAHIFGTNTKFTSWHDKIWYLCCYGGVCLTELTKYNAMTIDHEAAVEIYPGVECQDDSNNTTCQKMTNSSPYQQMETLHVKLYILKKPPSSVSSKEIVNRNLWIWLEWRLETDMVSLLYISEPNSFRRCLVSLF